MTRKPPSRYGMDFYTWGAYFFVWLKGMPDEDERLFWEFLYEGVDVVWTRFNDTKQMYAPMSLREDRMPSWIPYDSFKILCFNVFLYLIKQEQINAEKKT